MKTRTISWNTQLNFWFNRSLVTKLTIPSVPQGSFGYVLGPTRIQQVGPQRRSSPQRHRCKGYSATRNPASR